MGGGSKCSAPQKVWGSPRTTELAGRAVGSLEVAGRGGRKELEQAIGDMNLTLENSEFSVQRAVIILNS